MRVRRQTAVLCLVFLSTLQTRAAELPVTEVTLYKHGVGLFTRDGIVPPGQDVRLEFQNNDMNDLLKSLVITTADGAHVKAIRYDANETLEQRLSKFPFRLGEQQPLSSFLDTLKGARIELAVGSKTMSGSIVGARRFMATNVPIREQVTILQDSGDLTNYDLANIDSLHLQDAHQQQELKAYLQTLADSNARDQRSVFIESDAKDSRRLHLAYVAPNAIWKSSYRLMLDDHGPTLEGWAIVDNTTGDDWNNIRLAVVSGRPISFISPLYTARYGQRRVVDLPDDKAAGPVVYGGSLDETARLEPSAGNGVNENTAMNSRTGAVAGALSGGIYRSDRLMMAKEFPRLPLRALFKAQPALLWANSSNTTLPTSSRLRRINPLCCRSCKIKCKRVSSSSGPIKTANTR